MAENINEGLNNIVEWLNLTNDSVQQVRDEISVGNEYLDLTVDTISNRIGDLTESLQQGSLDQLESRREAAQQQQALMNLLNEMSENLQEGVKQREEIIKNQEEQEGIGLEGLGVLAGGLAVALGSLRGIISGYAKSFGVLLKTVRSISSLTLRATKALGRGLRSLAANSETLTRIGKSLTRGGARVSKAMNSIVGVFTGFAKSVRSIMGAAGALTRATVLAAMLQFNVSMMGLSRRINQIVALVRPIGTSIQNTGKLITTSLAPAINMFRDGIRVIMGPIQRAVGSIGTASKMFSSVGAAIARFMGPVRGIASVVSRVFAPLNFIFVAFKTIQGTLQGFREGGVLGALQGGITGFLNALVGVPLDFLRGAVAWILDLFGLDKLAEFLRGFSFTDIIKSIVSAPFDILFYIRDWISDKVKSVGRIVSSLIPDSIKKLFGIDGEDTVEGLQERRDRVQAEIDAVPAQARGREAIIRNKEEELAEIEEELRRARQERADRAQAERAVEEGRREAERRANQVYDDESIEPPSQPTGAQQTGAQLAMAQEESGMLDAASSGMGGGLNMQDNSVTSMTQNSSAVISPAPAPTRRPNNVFDTIYGVPDPSRVSW